MEPQTIQWEAAEHEHKERSTDWFWTVGIVVVAGAITAIILENFLFAIVILLAGFAITLFNARRPVVHEFELSQRGLRIGSKRYPYLTLESFWVEDEQRPDEPKLLVTSKKPFVPHLVIPLGNLDPQNVREFLLPLLKEEEQRESLAHHLFEWFGL